MRKTLLACALALLLSVSAYAGEMQCPAPAPPPSSSATVEDGTQGTFTQTILNVLGSVLALL